MAIQDSRHLIAVGFGLVLALTVALGSIGLSRMQAIYERMDVVVNEHNVKIALVTGMQNAARERSIILHHLAITADPFDREAGLQRFGQMASDFMVARDALRELTLSEAEAALLEETRRLVMRGTRIQEEVLELVLAGREEPARERLIHAAIPAQNDVLAVLHELLAYQSQSAAAAVGEAEEAYRYARAFMQVVGLAVLVLGVLIGYYVMRRTADVEAELAREKERAEVTLHAIGDGVITADTWGRIEYLNPMAQALTGWSATFARGRALEEVFRIEDERGRPLGSPLGSHLESMPDGPVVGLTEHAWLRARDGRRLPIEQGTAPLRDPRGRPIGALLVFRDVSKTEELARQLTWAATHDALTGLANRRQFDARLRELLAQARQEGEQHAVLYFDLDRFKLINDSCGHAAGDELLRALTKRLQESLRADDMLARLGGDEFGLLLEHCPLARAKEIAETCRQVIADYRFVWRDKVLEVGVSIGVVPLLPDSESPAAIMSAADAACYLAKDLGRNRVYVTSDENDVALVRRRGEMRWVERIGHALRGDGFCLYYQAIAPIAERAGQRCHYEVLLRMRDGDGSLIPPLAFLPAAERYNLMPAVDRWVIRATLAHLRAHRDPGLHLAINLSGQSLTDDRLLTFIYDEIEAAGVAPEQLCFEITETAAIANFERALELIRGLRARGCRFALDDFGSGMSSFGYLRELEVDYLKIDGSFVRDMLTDPVDHAIVEGIIRIGRIMNIGTIAEYVEDERVLLRLRELGADFAQGYGIHRPQRLDGPIDACFPVLGPALPADETALAKLNDNANG
ncbi:EAL domain-containing protein [Ectothiorhodospiraceae bacterium 2226]|nr:EAL domain-containing protein [Ectothiorhodospiraceae bacterium 2226]